MSANPIIVEGVVKPDGQLEVLDKVPLPVGRVQVTVVPLPDLPKEDPFWQMLQGIWESRKAAGLAPRSVEEVEAERRALRKEMEEEIQQAMQLQEESRRLRECAEQAERRPE